MLLTRLKSAAALLLLLAVFGAAALPRLAAQPTPNQPGTPPASPRKEVQAQGQEVEQFKKLYALSDGEVLKRVAPPFSPSRLVYYRQEHAYQAELIPAGPAVMYFRWKDGTLRNWGMTFSSSDPGTRLPSLVETLAGIYPQEIEGDEGLRTASITGDFIVREGVPAEKLLARLEEILRQDCKLPVKLTLREVERRVVVARGKYHATPLPGRKANEVELYGKELVPDSGAGGGTGDFQEFLKAAGMFMERRLVSAVEGAPAGEITWRYHRRSPSTAEERKEDTDPDGVLKHLSEQTGLTFKEEGRRVRVLFVERATD